MSQEFKYQHQLEQSNLAPIAKKTSRFDFYCGVLLFGLAFGVSLPLAHKYFNAPQQMAAKVPVEKVASAPEKTRNLKSASLEKNSAEGHNHSHDEAPAALATAAMPAPATEAPKAAAKVESAIAASKAAPEAPKLAMNTKPETKTEVKAAPVETKAAAKPVMSLSARRPIQAKAVPVSTARAIPVSASRSFKPATVLIEDNTVPSALVIAQQTDAATMTLQPSEAASAESAKFQTIYNASYIKETLKSCKRRCLLKARDANGKTIFAVVDGPNFADILLEHKGTINITGANKMFKSRDLFMVQSITFNLSPQASPASPASPNSNLSKRPAQAPSKLLPAAGHYEDLTLDTP